MNTELQEKIAHALYKRTVALDLWHEEQNHAKTGFRQAAYNFLEVLEQLGYEAVEKTSTQDKVEATKKQLEDLEDAIKENIQAVPKDGTKERVLYSQTKDEKSND